MNSRRAATLSNRTNYNLVSEDFTNRTSPHKKHFSLNKFYFKNLHNIYSTIKKKNVRVLEIGSGSGETTLFLLKQGANVTAVDVSKKQLKLLREKCKSYRDNLVIVNKEASAAIRILKNRRMKYDLIVATSLLHHIPDYISMIRESIELLDKKGVFFSFQDPLKYNTLTLGSLLFSKISYFSWRIFQGDFFGGFRRHLRRRRGEFLEIAEDNVEYHVVREGVDQDAIYKLFRENGYKFDLTKYFSTQNGFLQKVGESLGFKNSFMIISKKR